MKKIILTKTKNDFSYIRYFMFLYFKKYNLYKKYIKENIFFIPYKKRLNNRYLQRIKEFMKYEKITDFFTYEEEIKSYFKNYFCVIYGKNIYRDIFCDIINFMTKEKSYEYELIFISDNIKEIKILAEKTVKKVKSISVLTQKPFLYESMKDYFFFKYGVLLNIKTKKEKLKKHNKLYINCGANRTFDKNSFAGVNILDIYNVYEGAYKTIILESKGKEKEYTNLLKCPYLIGLAEFLHDGKQGKKYKIADIKK